MRKISLFFLMILIFMGFIFITGQSAVAFSSQISAFFGSSRDDIFGDYFLFTTPNPVSLDLAEVPLVAVLKMLSYQTGINFISTEAVKNRWITAYLDQVPLKKAVDILFKANNLTYEYYPEANIFVVKELGEPLPKLKAKVYQLEYARVGTARIHTEIETILADRERIRGDGQASGERTERIGLRDAVEAVLTEAGRVVENSSTNSLIVVDYPSQFPVIEEVIRGLDAPPLKVMIEVEVLDVDKNAIDKIGFRHEGIMADGLSGVFGPYHGAQYIGSLGSFADSSIFQTDYRVTAEFLKEDKTAKILARPRILTLNNETAEINVVSDEIVATEIEYDDERTTITVQRVSDLGDHRGAGVSLRVTPQISPSTDEITLILHPSVVSTSLSEFRDEWGNIFKNVDDRSTRSVVRLNDGETLLLAGLIEKGETSSRTGVPFLSDIPLLGAMFRHKEADNKDRELMIFLTPRIVGRQDYLARRRKPVRPLRREQGDLSRSRSIGLVLDSFTVR